MRIPLLDGAAPERFRKHVHESPMDTPEPFATDDATHNLGDTTARALQNARALLATRGSDPTDAEVIQHAGPAIIAAARAGGFF